MSFISSIGMLNFSSHHCMYMYINVCIHKHKHIFALKDQVLQTYYAGLEACECETKRDDTQFTKKKEKKTEQP